MYATLKDKIRAEKAERQADYARFADLIRRASDAGREAAEAAKPTPMTVVDYFTGKTWEVEDGACGFAWVSIRPANSRFGIWLKKQGIADKAYGGGLKIWIGDYGQSVTRKEAHARAMADVLSAAMPDLAIYAQSRLD